MSLSEVMTSYLCDLATLSISAEQKDLKTPSLFCLQVSVRAQQGFLTPQYNSQGVYYIVVIVRANLGNKAPAQAQASCQNSVLCEGDCPEGLS